MSPVSDDNNLVISNLAVCCPSSGKRESCRLNTKTGVDIFLHFFLSFSCSYETGSSAVTDIECQKKMICEIYQDANELGEVSARGRHSLDFMDTAQFFSLPDVLANTIDEFQVCS